jgi:hypothetical protein
MKISDWAISLALILLVVRQIRGRRLSTVGLLWPIALVGWAGYEYLGDIPDHRSDWTFVAVLTLIGLALGVGCGLLTSVYVEDKVAMARASGLAAALWIVGMGGRLAFGVAALHGGGAAIARMSERLDLHAAGTWSTALIVMALCEVVSRTAILALKLRAVSPNGRQAARPPSATVDA